jgi:hypothetical protein
LTRVKSRLTPGGWVGGRGVEGGDGSRCGVMIGAALGAPEPSDVKAQERPDDTSNGNYPPYCFLRNPVHSKPFLQA